MREAASVGRSRTNRNWTTRSDSCRVHHNGGLSSFGGYWSHLSAQWLIFIDEWCFEQLLLVCSILWKHKILLCLPHVEAWRFLRCSLIWVDHSVTWLFHWVFIVSRDQLVSVRILWCILEVFLWLHVQLNLSFESTAFLTAQYFRTFRPALLYLSG